MYESSDRNIFNKKEITVLYESRGAAVLYNIGYNIRTLTHRIALTIYCCTVFLLRLAIFTGFLLRCAGFT